MTAQLSLFETTTPRPRARSTRRKHDRPLAPETLDDERIIALKLAIVAATHAVHTVGSLWGTLSPEERDVWLEDARTITPRRDIALQTLVPANDKLLAEMRAVDS